jgi:hypothetical protein
MGYSLGASGAICAVLGIHTTLKCLFYFNEQFSSLLKVRSLGTIIHWLRYFCLGSHYFLLEFSKIMVQWPFFKILHEMC